MGVILILLSLLVSANGFLLGVETVSQQTLQYLVYMCATILFSSGFISLVIQFTKKIDYSDDLEEITKSLKVISDHYTLLEDERKAGVFTLQKQTEAKKEEIRLKSLSCYNDLLNDPEIKEEAAMLLKIYGPKAHEEYLQKKMKEFNIKN